MAGGRDLSRRSPRWLNGVIWSSGVGAAGVFLWRTLYGDGEPTCFTPGLTVVLSKAAAVLVLPLLLCCTFIAKGVRWVIDG